MRSGSTSRTGGTGLRVVRPYEPDEQRQIGALLTLLGAREAPPVTRQTSRTVAM